MTRLPAPLSPLLRRIVLADAAFEFVAALLFSGLIGRAHFWLNVAQGITVTGAGAFALLGAGLAGAAIYRGTTEGFVRYEDGTNYHTGFTATVTLEDGRKRTVEGEVKGFIPLRNRRAGQFTHIGEGMTEYTLDGTLKGYGLSEFLDQVE